MLIEFFIVALNEENNISDCINSIKDYGGDFITILDGGSRDLTVCIAEKMGCKVVVLEGTSISYRRGYAVQNSSAEYICFVDGDQKLIKESNIIHAVHKYFDSISNLAGLQFSLIAENIDNSYWADGFSRRLSIITGTPGSRVVIGTPCIFKASLAKKVGYDTSLTGSSDDTVFCARLIESGYKLLAIDEQATEKVRASFKSTIRKAYWYGLGDSEYLRVVKESSLRRRHIYHVVVRGLLIYPIKISKTNLKLIPFFIIFGFSRILGMFCGAFSNNDLSRTKS
jgi:glycosyltransferase involved in cell wall biosynthesis